MKRIITFSLLALMFSPVIQGADVQQIFDSANALYEKGAYREALGEYQKLENSLSHWKLFFNMGNCHFKLNQFLQAKIYYLKARKLKPVHPSIEKNIQVVNRRFRTGIPEPRVDFIRRMVLKLESLIPINLVSLLLIVSVFSLNIFIFWLLKGGKKKSLLYLLFLSLLLVLVISAYHLTRTQKQSSSRIAVITQADSQLRSGPGRDNTVLFTVQPGLEVKILDSSRDWVQVSAYSEIAGWIPRDGLLLIQ